MYDLRTVLEGADQLEAWVTAFEAGEPAELLLLGSSHGLASNRYTFLLYDGGDSYTCLDAHAGTSLTETAVWKNRVGWEIAGVVPLIQGTVSPDLQYQQDEPWDPSVRDHLLAPGPGIRPIRSRCCGKSQRAPAASTACPVSRTA